jgi:predicted methyltransferase
MRTAVLVCTAMATLSFGAAAPAQPLPGYIAAAVADPDRPAADTQRDARRQPTECLALAGLKPGDRIADVYPGGGYYSRIFSKVVGPSGRVYALVPQVVAAQASGVLADTKAQFAGADYQNVGVLVAATNRAVFKALKPGGIYIVTDHAAAPGSNFLDLEPDMSRRLHRIDPAIVKRQVLAAGFVLEAQSGLLANDADPHAASAFDPAIRGKTDQFFFKFRKPR